MISWIIIAVMTTAMIIVDMITAMIAVMTTVMIIDVMITVMIALIIAVMVDIAVTAGKISRNRSANR